MNYGRILGVEVAGGSRGELLKKCRELMAAGGAVSTVNPEIIANAQSDPELYSALSGSLNIPDGIGVESAMKRRGVLCERFPGVELGEALLDLKPSRLAIIGGRGSAPRRALKNLCRRHPLAEGTFYMDGYNYSVEKFVHNLKKYEPDIVFVCLGSPRQEIFINRVKRCAPGALFVALGGSVDIYSEDKRRAPKLMRKLGAEWLYRIAKEPQRIKRVPKLLAFVCKDALEVRSLRQNARKSSEKS